MAPTLLLVLLHSFHDAHGSSSCCRAAVDKACTGRGSCKDFRNAVTRKIPIKMSRSRSGFRKLVRIELIVVPVLGLAVLLFEMLGHEECGITQLLDVGNVVILGNVNPADCS
ncbi:hypothetical protein V6N12_013100 [Hibiscus sabdariffa]|uniref:Uncharacterized protein n=1 Tax=Hibiscus sabdariffa TaxID=183260 RepID=A0ABR2EGC1_9ROSI